MAEETNLKEVRLEKLGKLEQLGINPYPLRTKRTHTVAQALEKEGEKVTIVGRMMSYREHGNIAFADVQDSSGKMQVFFQKAKLNDFFKHLKLLDIGDFIQIEGEVGKTVAGEISVIPDSFQILAKSLLPLPSEWYGLKDIEIRYRKRYLDLLLNKESKNRFVLRSHIISAVREYLQNDGAMEVETPTLQTLYGGANARPFMTHHNALDSDFYLKISDELYLKRLVVGGIEKVFEIDHDFRNEGIDKSHNPEFTMLEVYYAYANYEDMMTLTENLYQHAATKVLGTTTILYQGVAIDVKAPWRRLTMKDAIKEYLGFDVNTMSDKEILEAIRRQEQEYDGKGEVRGMLIAKLFEFTEQHLIQPTFIIDFPKETTALCKPKEDDPDTIERFEPYINGWEIGNAYTELNNPVLQRKYFEDQLKTYEKNKEEAQPLDEDFLAAMEHGMPPMGGLGLGLDRMVMILTDAKAIKDVILFPTLKKDKVEKEEVEARPESDSVQTHDNASMITSTADVSQVKITRDDAYTLLQKYMSSPNLLKHSLAAEVAMKGIYRHLYKDSNLRAEEIWGITGLLHDVDYEVAQNENLLEKHGRLLFDRDPNLIEEPVQHAIKAHNYTKTGTNPETDLDWAIATVDQLTGLVVSSALIHPDKKLASIDADFVMNRFNKPGFSKGVDRENIRLCETKLGIPLTEFIEITLKSMQQIAPELGL